jgi:hypothetical protein
MSKTIKLLMSTCILVLFSHPVHAQTINALSCSSNDLSKALSSVNQATATVNIPPGTCHWGNGSALTYSAPPNVTSLTIQGQTTCTGSGDPAQNNLTCTDRTIIVNDDNGTSNQDSNWLINIGGSGLVRWTGITLEEGANTGMNNAMLSIGGAPLRIDHNHFNLDTFTGSVPEINPIGVGGCTNGVADHNVFDSMSAVRTNSITIQNGTTCNGASNGDGVWAAPTNFGASNFFFVENNVFNFKNSGSAQQADDCVVGGRFVWRFNTMYNEAHLQTHNTGSAGPTSSHRGCRAFEIYGNLSPYNMGTNYIPTFLWFSSGTAIVWGNTVQAGFANFIKLQSCRPAGGNCGYSQVAPPAGWGFCDNTSAWDGNQNGHGYPCIDQPTRGQGDLLSGVFPNKVDAKTGTVTWPHQKLEPLYAWLNSYSPLPNGNGNPTLVTNTDTNYWTQNVDYYVSADQNSGKDCNGFTGASGIGCGPRSSRPSTCTAGVAWWSTDQGSWNQSGNGFGNGVLDICTSTNTWTNASYTPYTYPHPLVTGSTGPPPAPPTNIQISVN